MQKWENKENKFWSSLELYFCLHFTDHHNIYIKLVRGYLTVNQMDFCWSLTFKSKLKNNTCNTSYSPSNSLTLKTQPSTVLGLCNGQSVAADHTIILDDTLLEQSMDFNSNLLALFWYQLSSLMCYPELFAIIIIFSFFFYIIFSVLGMASLRQVMRWFC